jgi:hypothetical protein
LTDCYVLFVDNSPVSPVQKERISQYVDEFLIIDKSAWIKKTQIHYNKGVPYWALVLAGLSVLKNAQWDLLHIICGRYEFTSHLNLAHHKTDCFNLRYFPEYPIASTRYYSVGGKIPFDTVFKTHQFCYNKGLMGYGSEPMILRASQNYQCLLGNIGIAGVQGSGIVIEE